MALTPQERGRYARHLLLPEIGLAGQERLVRARYRVAPSAPPLAAAFARTYLDRAGLREEASGATQSAASDAGDAPVALDLPDETVVRAVAGRPELEPAAAALVGALHAVEAVKRALELGTPMPLVDLLPLPPGEGHSARPSPQGEVAGHLSLSLEDV